LNFELTKSQAILIDVQEKLFPVMSNKDELLKKTVALVKGLQLLNIPLIVSEQYPEGLGETKSELKRQISDTANFYTKSTFSCLEEERVLKNILVNKRNQVIVFGIETHICVLQTCIDLIKKGHEVCVVVDACASRNVLDKNVAIERLKQEGVFVTSVESILFEL